MSEINIVRRRERSGTETQAKSAVLMDAELGVITDVKKLVVGDGNKKGGYTLTPDNIVAVWPDQTDAGSPLSLAWWIKRAGGAETKLRLTAGAYNIQDDLTVPSNIYLDIDKGAVINIASGKTLTLNCEIGADVQPVFSGGGAVAENYIRRLVVNENLVRHQDWSTGFRDNMGEVRDEPDDSSSGYYSRYYLRSPMIPITPSTQYTIKAWSAICKCRLSFFDHEKKYISQLSPAEIQKGYTFITPETAAYVEINSWLPMSPSGYYYTRIEDVGKTHCYKLEKGPVATSFSLAIQDAQTPWDCTPVTRPKNNPESARQLVSCAESYKGKGWAYGNDQTLHDDMTLEGPDAAYLVNSDGVKQIDCGTLMYLAMNGINYYHSKYFDSNLPWRGTKYYGWGTHPNKKYMEGFAKWIIYNSWEIDPGENFNNLQAGDLVFWGKVADDGSKTASSLRGIEHVGMYTGRWVSDPDRGNELHPQTIEVASTQPIVTNRFLDRATTTTQIVLFARIPLGSPYTEYDNGVKGEPLGVIYSSSYRPSVYAVGNGKQLRIDIYGRNAAVWSIGTINAETGAVTDDYQYHAYCNLIPVNFLMKSAAMAKLNELGYTYYHFFWYDSKGNYISESVSYSDKPAEASYYRSRYYKNNAVHSSTVWDQDDIAVMNRLGGIQYFTRDTASEYVDKNTAIYPKGYYSSVCLDTVIPSGAYLDRRNGRYAYTSGQMEWTELPESDQTKLNALRIGDGENNVYVPNAQHVKLMRQAMDY